MVGQCATKSMELQHSVSAKLGVTHLMVGTVNAEINVPSDETLQLLKVLSLSVSSLEGVGQNIALHALPTARKSACLNSDFLSSLP